MAQSQNSTVDLATPATCLMGLTSHGNVMVGNKAFEYYNERNPEDYIQIPWDEVDYIAAEVLRGTKKITRFAIFTKDNGHFTFSTRDDKETLRAVRKYVDEDKLAFARLYRCDCQGRQEHPCCHQKPLSQRRLVVCDRWRKMHPGIRSHSGMHFPFERQLGKLVPFFSRIPGWNFPYMWLEETPSHYFALFWVIIFRY